MYIRKNKKNPNLKRVMTSDSQCVNVAEKNDHGFFHYSSILNLHNWTKTNVLRNNDDWVMTEKVHGANFSFYLDSEDGEIICGKRNGFIPKVIYLFLCCFYLHANSFTHCRMISFTTTKVFCNTMKKSSERFTHSSSPCIQR